MESKAVLRLARVSPRKARLVADLVRGMDVGEALEVLTFTRKKSAGLIKGLVESAVANAEYKANRSSSELDVDRLVVQQIFVDQGPTLRRFRPRARGMATKVLKKTSHITVVLAEGEV
ncbi:MAG: 50S ribosomal protein L22 [Deltaproteobacteria bacterium]|nr:50S ribosomal protein L22 [Deltaproteobacteria bacterium]HCH63701.1 50S ribosomal protein L22 [Deltaproteobacteria bacterium]